VAPTFPARPRRDHITGTLSAGRLGPGGVMSFVLAAAAPLTVTAGIISTGYAVTGMTGLPIAFIAVGGALALFAVGYVAMARHITSAGAFYTYVSRGLGRPAGVGAAWVALITYNVLQVALYGGIGAAAGPLLERLGVSVPWWLLALLCWSVVGMMGLLRVDLNGRVLAVLLAAEILVIIVFSLAGLLNPSSGSLALESFSPTALLTSEAGVLFAIAALGFVGFESGVVYSEESKDPRRTVPRAIYTAITVITIAFALSTWTMQADVGPDQIVAVARSGGGDTFFLLASANLPIAFIVIGRILFTTGMFAAMNAVHNTTARYVFALGREGLLPREFGRTHPRTGAPVIGSLFQSGVAVVVIAMFAIGDVDPLVALFYGGGTVGAIGILVLAAATSVAIVAFFRRRRDGLTPARWAAALASVVILSVMLGLALSHIPTLLGVPADSPLGWIVPAVFAAAAVGGLAWGVALHRVRPDLYRQIGYGATAPMSDH
jgi:amino acid transporter